MYKILLFHAEKVLFHERKHFFCVFLLVLMLIRNFQIDVDIYRKNGELYERFRKRRKRRDELWRLNVTINGIVPVHTIVRVTGNVVQLMIAVLKHWRRITVSFKERNKEFHKESQRIKLLDGNQWIIYNKIYPLVFFI